MVRMYDREGNFSGTRSIARIQQLIELGRVTVKRDKRGNIRAAYETRVDGSPNADDRLTAGTKYTFLDKLPSGRTCHDLKRLHGGRDGWDYAPESMRPIFLEVIKSCTVSA